jgi:hypothetical protein
MSTGKMAVSATLHCLTGCAVGEIAGMVIGTAFNLHNGAMIVLSIVLAFVFGLSLSARPLLKAGLGLRSTLPIVLAADTLSITTMEIVDNLVIVLIPGALNAKLNNLLFWSSMTISLAVAFVVAVPVNYYLLKRNKGHALTMRASGHDHHHGE